MEMEDLELWLKNKIEKAKVDLHNLEQVYVRLFDTRR